MSAEESRSSAPRRCSRSSRRRARELEALDEDDDPDKAIEVLAGARRDREGGRGGARAREARSRGGGRCGRLTSCARSSRSTSRRSRSRPSCTARPSRCATRSRAAASACGRCSASRPREAAGATPEQALPAAAALELVHSFSLVHDDLPALDDDAERRGQPSVWAAYGEATAILAGDALLAEAFRLALSYPTPHAGRELAEATLGMIGGQYLDVDGTAPRRRRRCTG